MYGHTTGCTHALTHIDLLTNHTLYRPKLAVVILSHTSTYPPKNALAHQHTHLHPTEALPFEMTHPHTFVPSTSYPHIHAYLHTLQARLINSHTPTYPPNCTYTSTPTYLPNTLFRCTHTYFTQPPNCITSRPTYPPKKLF